MMNWEFVHPHWLWLLLVLPFLGVWFFWRRREAVPSVSYPGAAFLAAHAANWPARLWWLPPVLRLAAIGLVIVALARPRTAEENVQREDTRGIDIMVSIDVSASMLAQDFEPNRLKATKQITTRFIQGRPRDRIGIVAFAGESYTQTPLTSDKDILLNNLGELQNGLVQDGTAIGMGLATAVNRLKESRAESKVVILLSDGVNNSGSVSPATAISLAEEYAIRVYTIGVGSQGKARMPVAYDPSGGYRFGYVPVKIDEALLEEIAETTGGAYFRATDGGKLQAIYQEIDKLEKTKLKEEKFYTYTEKFTGLALAALILFALELLLRYTVFKSFV
jgi:Ca-activated chloride channel family protein